MTDETMDDASYRAWKAAKRAPAPHPPTGDDAEFGAWKAAKAAPRHDYHAEFASGALARRMEDANTRDQANAADPDAERVGLPRAFLHSVLATGANLAQGLPGVEAAQAGARSVVRRQPYREALSDIRSATGKIPGALRTAERIAGAIPAAAVLPGGVVAGGATLGAADAALSADPQSLGERALHTAAGAATGAVAGKVLHGVANVAQRTGVTDAIAGGLRKVPGALADMGEAMGVRGAGNRLAGARQAILDVLSGSEKSAAQTMIDHADQYHAEARKLYGVAKADTKVVGDPRVQRVLRDNRVQQILQVARERLGMTPALTEVAPAVPGRAAIPSVPRSQALAAPAEAVPVEPQRPASIREAIAAFDARRVAAVQRTEGTVAQQQAREALARRTAEAELPAAPPSVVPARLNEPRRALPMVPDKPAVYADLPTPEELAMTKRLLRHVVEQKFNAPQGISSAEAAQMSPLLDDLRSALHDASPAWKDADAFYSHAKNFETTFQKAYGASQTPTAAGLDPSKLRTPEAITAFVEKKAGTPVGRARASGQQAGTAARLSEALKSAPLGQNIGETLDAANGVFKPSTNAAQLRRPAFASDDAAREFAQKLALTRAISEREAASQGPTAASLMKPWQAITPQNPLATTAGTMERTRLAALLADPSKRDAVRAALKSAERGSSLLDILQKAGLLAGNASL